MGTGFNALNPVPIISLQFDQSCAAVELAAVALNYHPAQIAKSISFMVDKQAILVVTAGDKKIDNSKYKVG